MKQRSDLGWALSVVGVLALTLVSLVGHGLLAFVLLPAPTPTPVAGPVTTPTSTGTGTDPSGAQSGGSSTGTGTATATVPPVPDFDAAACLKRDNPPTGAKIPAGNPYGDDITDLGTKAELQRLYAVTNGTLVPIDGGGAVRRCDQQLWDVVRATAPSMVAHIGELMIFDANPNPSADEFVIDGEARPKRLSARTFDTNLWRLSFAPNGLARDEVAWLVAHELAHLLSLNADQMLSGIGRDSCATWYVGTGCPLRDSYFYRYFQNTWSDDIFREWDKADSAPDDAAQRKAFQALYDRHPDSFVTSYAATNPLEDFAESFAMWCTYAPDETERKNLPKGDQQAGGKVEWFTAARRDLVPEVGAGCQMLREFAVS